MKNIILIILIILIINFIIPVLSENVINEEESKLIITLNKNNTVFVTDEINEDSMSKVIYKIIHLNVNDIYLYRFIRTFNMDL